MDPTHVESAINRSGQAAVFVRPLAAAPSSAAVVGGRVTLLGVPGEPALRIAREAAQAAQACGWLLVVETEGNRVTRDTRVRVAGAGKRARGRGG